VPEPKAGRKVSRGCLCGVTGLVIGLGTLGYAVVNRKEFLYVDSTGLPAGPLSFACCCGPLLLSAVLCTIGLVSERRRRSPRPGDPESPHE
jgi:hypothetical protein